MARVKGFLTLQGSMGETSFRKIGAKSYAYDKLNVSLKRRLTDSSFVSVRKNAKEFGSASSIAKLIRVPIDSLISEASDVKAVNRLNSLMMKVLKKENFVQNRVVPSPSQPITVAVRGTPFPIINDHCMHLLLGFDFNDKVRLSSTFNVPYQTLINRLTGELTFKFPAYIPKSSVKAPKNASQFRYKLGVVELDVAGKKSGGRQEVSDLVAIDGGLRESQEFVIKLQAGIKGTVFMILGLDFYDESGYFYSSHEERRKVNPLGIVEWEKAVE